MKILNFVLVAALALPGIAAAEEGKAVAPTAQTGNGIDAVIQGATGGGEGAVGGMAAETPIPLVCPIIGLNSTAITAGAIPALATLQQRMTALNQQLQQQRQSNPECARAGQGALNLVQSVSQTGMCERSPINCSQNIAEVAANYISCPSGSRDDLIDITLSTVMAFGSGPVGIMALGASAVNSIIRLFRGRSQERAQENAQRETRLAQQTFIDGLASCATSDLYSSSVCTGPQRNRLGEALRNLNAREACSTPIPAPTSAQARVLLSSLRQVDTCLTAPEADPQRCFASLPPATEANAVDKGMCLLTNTGGSFAQVLQETRDSNLQDSLRMARRFHIQKIISLRQKAQTDDDPNIRQQLILNCYLGRLSMSVSANQGQEQNPMVRNGNRRQDELSLQDETDDRSIYRGYPDSSNDPNIVTRPPRLAPSFASAQNICNQLNTCFQGRNTFSNREFEGPNLRAQMCRGLSRLNDRNGLLDQYNMMAFEIDASQQNLTCREPAAVPRTEESAPADEGSRGSRT